MVQDMEDRIILLVNANTSVEVEFIFLLWTRINLAL